MWATHESVEPNLNRRDFGHYSLSSASSAEGQTRVQRKTL